MVVLLGIESSNNILVGFFVVFHVVGNLESIINESFFIFSLSGFNFLEIGLPPASPCENDIAPRVKLLAFFY